MEHDIVQKANDWREKFCELAEGYGDAWFVNMFPPSWMESTEPQTFTGDITISGLDADDDGVDWASFPIPDEQFARLICHLFNNTWTIIDDLVDEIERLKQVTP